MIHEILHWSGAVDVYDPGFTFIPYPTYRDEALVIDPRTDESIMGQRYKSCMEEGGTEKDGNICTKEEIEELYLDEYNKQKMGIF